MIYLESEKQVSGTDIINAVKDICDNPAHPASKYQIWDYSQAIELSLSTTDMRALYEISHTQAHPTKSSIAIVAPNPSVNYRLQALLHFVGTPCHTQIFENHEDARFWLNTLPL